MWGRPRATDPCAQAIRLGRARHRQSSRNRQEILSLTTIMLLLLIGSTAYAVRVSAVGPTSLHPRSSCRRTGPLEVAPTGSRWAGQPRQNSRGADRLSRLIRSAQFEYAFDDIGNRKSTAVGGDSAGANLRSASYTPDLLNRYSQRTVPGANGISGPYERREGVRRWASPAGCLLIKRLKASGHSPSQSRRRIAVIPAQCLTGAAMWLLGGIWALTPLRTATGKRREHALRRVSG